jgi:hypothetical protein
VEAYFADVWAHSLPGELYVPGPGNIGVFTDSLITATLGRVTADAARG